MNPTTPRIAELTAPAAWQVVDFISDLHLQASEPATAQAWEHYMVHTRADAVFILGDLFEVWVGDDGPASTWMTSSFVSPRPTMMPDLVSTSGAISLYFFSRSSDHW